MEKGQMGSSSDGLPAPADATPDDGSEPPQRGLIGRIINALTPAAATDVMDVSPAPAPAATTDAPHILNLRRLRVDDVATPNAEIVAVPLTIGLDDLVAKFRESGYSRLPVYKGRVWSCSRTWPLNRALAPRPGFPCASSCARSCSRHPRCPWGSFCRRCRRNASTWPW
jgi:hypothetical protein